MKIKKWQLTKTAKKTPNLYRSQFTADLDGEMEQKTFMKRPSIAFALNLLLEPVLGASVGNIDKERVGSFSLSPNSTVLHLDIFCCVNIQI